MVYQPEVWFPTQGVWVAICQTQKSLADAIRCCWLEQQLWSRQRNATKAECRIAFIENGTVAFYKIVPQDADFNQHSESDLQVIHSWNCAVQSYDWTAKMASTLAKVNASIEGTR